VKKFTFKQPNQLPTRGTAKPARLLYNYFEIKAISLRKNIGEILAEREANFYEIAYDNLS